MIFHVIKLVVNVSELFNLSSFKHILDGKNGRQLPRQPTGHFVGQIVMVTDDFYKR